MVNKMLQYIWSNDLVVKTLEVDSALNHFEVNQMRARNYWRRGGKM